LEAKKPSKENQVIKRDSIEGKSFWGVISLPLLVFFTFFSRLYIFLVCMALCVCLSFYVFSFSVFFLFLYFFLILFPFMILNRFSYMFF
jgi:hypothetical protein